VRLIVSIFQGQVPCWHSKRKNSLNRVNIFFLKGIVSRDLHICFWYQSICLKFLHRMELFVCFLNFVFVSNFWDFRKLQHENEILKANEPAPYVLEL
jgi:hypothetical protein